MLILVDPSAQRPCQHLRSSAQSVPTPCAGNKGQVQGGPGRAPVTTRRCCAAHKQQEQSHHSQLYNPLLHWRPYHVPDWEWQTREGHGAPRQITRIEMMSKSCQRTSVWRAYTEGGVPKTWTNTIDQNIGRSSCLSESQQATHIGEWQKFQHPGLWLNYTFRHQGNVNQW